MSDLLPATDGLFLGSDSKRWDGSKLLFPNIATDLIPATTKTYNLGSSTRLWNDARIKRLMLSTAEGEGVYSSLIPAVNNSRYLGSSSYRWAGIFSTDIQLWRRLVMLDATAPNDRWYFFETETPANLMLWVRHPSGNETGLWYFDASVEGAEKQVSPIDLDMMTSYLKIGHKSNLPTADSTYRGKLIRVEGGASVADKLYVCMKAASDAYSWVQVASG